MTIEEIEAACNQSLPLDFSRHSMAAPELSLSGLFYPFGFPTELRTNSAEIMARAEALWSHFNQHFDTLPIRVDIHVVEDNLSDGIVICPPAPSYRTMLPLMMAVADRDNYSVANLEQARTQVTISQATMQHPSYLNYFFLDAAPMCHIATRYTTPVHAGCVSLDGHGVLLCGDSGAGKSSLSYACGRAGWQYVTDDATFLLREGVYGDRGRLVTGNCNQVRFRPSAAELFPEVEGLEITPRAAGKPSIELPTASLPGLICAQTAQVDFLVFLNRREQGVQELRPYRKDVARYFMKQVLFGPADSLREQFASIERLLTAEIFELRYNDLEWAVDRLQTLVREGR